MIILEQHELSNVVFYCFMFERGPSLGVNDTGTVHVYLGSAFKIQPISSLLFSDSVFQSPYKI